MKEILSYLDIPIIVIIIYISIIYWKKCNRKFEDEELNIEIDRKTCEYEEWKEHSLRIRHRTTMTIISIVIFFCLFTIYMRIFGDLPNIFLCIKHLIIQKIQRFNMT